MVFYKELGDNFYSQEVILENENIDGKQVVKFTTELPKLVPKYAV